MTDLATALAATPLTDFEGLHVIASGIEIPGAAGGLQPAMKIDPQEFHQGEVVHVVMRCVVGKIRHEPLDKDAPRGAQRRVHVFQVTDATIVDEDTVAEAIEAQRVKIAKAKEAELALKGEGPLPGLGWDEDAQALQAEHADGQHAAGLRDGCPSCDAERAAEDEEATPDA